MGFSFGVRRAVVSWIACHNIFPVPCPVVCERCPNLPYYPWITKRYYTPDDILPHQASQELSVCKLLDMGFTDSQAEHLYHTVSKSKGGATAKHTLSTLSALIVLGLNATSVLKVVEKCPELYTVNESQLQQRIVNLRKLGLIEGSLQRVVSYHPQILTMKLKKINHLAQFLKEKCRFTTQQVTVILRDSPAVIQEDLDQLQYKFQYVYFRMGLKQTEMVKSRLFRFTLEDVRNRHCFLERRGMYETPDKKGQTTIVNPKLSSILSVDQDMFVTQVAKGTVEEFDVFQRLMERERQEEELLADFDSISGDDEDDDEEEDDVEEEGESMGKMGYMKKKKK